jgi:hypothetical protein
MNSGDDLIFQGRLHFLNMEQGVYIGISAKLCPQLIVKPVILYSQSATSNNSLMFENKVKL